MKAVVLTLSLSLLSVGCRQPQQSQKTAAVSTAEPDSAVQMSLVQQREAGIQVEKVVARQVPEILHVTGRLALDENRTWRVGAVTEGQIVQVIASVGDRVRPGDVLARMHTHEVHDGRAEYRKAVAELAKAQQAEVLARRVRDREHRLLNLRATSQQNVERADAEWQATRTAVISAEAEVQRARSHLEEFLGVPAERGEGQGDEADLVPIKTPAAGTVLARNVTPGTIVQPSSDAYVVSDLNSLWLIASVSEAHLAQLRIGMPVKLFSRAYGDRAFSGKIAHIGETLDPATRTVTVRVVVPNERAELKPEMYVTGEVELGATEPGLFVPENAIQEVKGVRSVFIRRGEDQFVCQPVELGRTLESCVQVLRGISSGDTVVTAGSYILKSQLMKSSMTEE
jgi:cobalt-zinc-cadmium efflux system membrane fusion protein